MNGKIKVARSIKRSSVLRILVGFPIVYAVLSLVVFFGSNLIAAVTPRDHYFHYESVSFVEKRDDHLIFASKRQIIQPYPMRFNDILRCGDKEFRFYSHQDAHNEVPSVNRIVHVVTWNYNEPFPTGEKCHLESHITMRVGVMSTKQQTVVSDVFVVEGER